MQEGASCFLKEKDWGAWQQKPPLSFQFQEDASCFLKEKRPGRLATEACNFCSESWTAHE
jgi:hypothetical protein